MAVILTSVAAVLRNRLFRFVDSELGSSFEKGVRPLPRACTFFIALPVAAAAEPGIIMLIIGPDNEKVILGTYYGAYRTRFLTRKQLYYSALAKKEKVCNLKEGK